MTGPLPHNPQPYGDRQRQFRLRPPNPRLKYLEARALFEISALVPSAKDLLGQPRGDGRSIVSMPGFLADDRSMWPLRRFLSHLGYAPRGWGLGLNRGNPQKLAERFVKRIDENKPTAPLTLIGWSLGGVVARLVAIHRPDAVREIITMGTPVEGGPKYTSTGEYYAKERGLDLDAFEREVHKMNQRPIRAPITVIYSKTDAIVGWRAAIDRYNRHARHVEVPGSHLGLGFSPRVWRIVAQTLHKSSDSASAEGQIQ